MCHQTLTGPALRRGAVCVYHRLADTERSAHARVAADRLSRRASAARPRLDEEQRRSRISNDCGTPRTPAGAKRRRRRTEAHASSDWGNRSLPASLRQSWPWRCPASPFVPPMPDRSRIVFSTACEPMTTTGGSAGCSSRSVSARPRSGAVAISRNALAVTSAPRTGSSRRSSVARLRTKTIAAPKLSTVFTCSRQIAKSWSDRSSGATSLTFQLRIEITHRPPDSVDRGFSSLLTALKRSLPTRSRPQSPPCRPGSAPDTAPACGPRT